MSRLFSDIHRAHPENHYLGQDCFSISDKHQGSGDAFELTFRNFLWGSLLCLVLGLAVAGLVYGLTNSRTWIWAISLALMVLWCIAVLGGWFKYRYERCGDTK